MTQHATEATMQNSDVGDTEITLISHVLCPYVQRSVILLKEQGTSYQRLDIDLANKPDWFAKVSPLGKVPVLMIEGKESLFESQVICEYLDEINISSMHPDNAYEKAHHRSWIEFGSGILGDIVGVYNATNKAGLEQSLRSIQTKLSQIEKQLSQGPFFSGEKFQVIDAVYSPIFRYFNTLEKYVDCSFFEALPKISAWRHALSQRTSVQTAVAIDYPERLETFFKARQGYLASLIP